MNFSSMLVDSSSDLCVFFATFLCGQLTGLILDFFRSMRKVFSFGKKSVAVQDIILCAFGFFAFSTAVATFNNGALRWYEFAGVILGIVIYMLAESVHVMRLSIVVWRVLKGFVLGAKKVICVVGKKIAKSFSRLRAKKKEHAHN